ncbi:unnamed protein product [Amoebophrya sp. A25]|nr:unnamed protein product [Amoebophrya sp. A25]|eukprot:GSA25T00023991001.1
MCKQQKWADEYLYVQEVEEVTLLAEMGQLPLAEDLWLVVSKGLSTLLAEMGQLPVADDLWLVGTAASERRFWYAKGNCRNK